MKYKFATIALALLPITLSASAIAADYGYKNKDYGYESSAGRKYEYDSARTTDVNRYKNDFNAQQRDSLSNYKSNNAQSIKEKAYGDYGRGLGVLDE